MPYCLTPWSYLKLKSHRDCTENSSQHGSQKCIQCLFLSINRSLNSHSWYWVVDTVESISIIVFFSKTKDYLPLGYQPTHATSLQIPPIYEDGGCRWNYGGFLLSKISHAPFQTPRKCDNWHISLAYRSQIWEELSQIRNPHNLTTSTAIWWKASHTILVFLYFGNGPHWFPFFGMGSVFDGLSTFLQYCPNSRILDGAIIGAIFWMIQDTVGNWDVWHTTYSWQGQINCLSCRLSTYLD